ncbi:MAG: response regulator, partial [Deltaproteobacteria bacterium]|nr:response regulator [Deltaproteobacteria bacterium]
MSNSTSRPGKLLIVDDDVQLLRGAARWLRHEGHETFTATSPEQALPLLARHGVEVVIADHYFEASSPTTGIEFLEHIELHWPGCGRILITGAEQREVLEEAVNVGHVQRILLKPVDRTRLLEAVAEVLALTRLTEENRQLQQENRRQLSALEAAKSDLERMVAQRTMELSQAKREWERTFDAIQEPIAILTPDQEVRRGNLALAAHARVPIQQVVGSRCHRLMFQRKEPCPACPFVVTRQRGEPARGEVRDAKMGSTFQVHTYPVLDGSGALFSIVCWYKDITEQQRLYQRVLHTEKMASLGTLASGVAHEINNPLAGILTWTQILLAE